MRVFVAKMESMPIGELDTRRPAADVHCLKGFVRYPLLYVRLRSLLWCPGGCRCPTSSCSDGCQYGELDIRTGPSPPGQLPSSRSLAMASISPFVLRSMAAPSRTVAASSVRSFSRVAAKRRPSSSSARWIGASVVGAGSAAVVAFSVFNGQFGLELQV